jgi:disulfide bond formation protein DsbB
MLKKLKKMYPHQTLMMFFILGLLIIAGSFTVEHVFGVKPCDMCLWQRYLAVAITIVAFIGTLFRGRIKKLFIATITLLAAASLTVGVWQSLSQRDIVGLPEYLCQAHDMQATTSTPADAKQESEDLLANLKANEVDFVDCSKIENFFLYNYTGISLANVNVLLMTFVMLFSFYKLFFKPRKRFRKFKKNHKHNKGGNNQRRRYRGSGYNRANNRNNRRHHHGNNKHHHRRNDEQ